MVLDRLDKARLHLDIDESELSVQRTKCLGFVLEARKGVSMGPENVCAIRQWTPPSSRFAVESFLGFAHFYRKFIENFASITRLLTHLTRKTSESKWTRDADAAFNTLKETFVTTPILVQFDTEKKTLMETDSSSYAVDGILSQTGRDGVLRPGAFSSWKNTPGECNYPIADKELLAFIKCLDQWDAHLRSVDHFDVVTDSKNLVYYTTSSKLSEPQMRLAKFLSRYNFDIHYRPGKQSTQPDVLSLRDQDVPKDQWDERFIEREITLLRPDKTHGFPPVYQTAVQPGMPLRQPSPSHTSNILRVLPAALDGPALEDLLHMVKLIL